MIMKNALAAMKNDMCFTPLSGSIFFKGLFAGG